MPASLAFWTAARSRRRPALSRMIAAALREIAVSMAWLCLVGSSSWLSDEGLVAELLGLGRGGVLLGLEEDIVR